MMKGVCFMVAVLLHVAIARYRGPPDMPLECRGGPKPRGMEPRECCEIGIFKDEDFEACGFDKPKEGGHHRHGPGPEGDEPFGPREGNEPHGPRPEDGPHCGHRCTKQLCLMKKYNLIKNDNTTDTDAVATFLEEFVEQKPDFKTAVEDAKVKCLEVELGGPPEMCDAKKIMHCLTDVMFVNCPASLWNDTEACTTMKTHMEKCSPTFRNKEEAVYRD